MAYVFKKRPHHEITLSPSAINTFYAHPYKWWLTYHCGYRSEESIHLHKGTAVHEALEKIFDETRWPKDETYREDMMKKALILYDIAWEQPILYKLELGFKTDEENKEQLAAHKKDGAHMVEMFVNSFCDKIYGMLVGGKATSAGLAYKMLKPTFREIYLKDEDLLVGGYIDAVIESHGEVTIVDYKTSNKYRDEFPVDYVRQLAIYAYLYEKKFGTRPNMVGIAFLRFNEHYYIKVDDALLAYALKEISYVRSHINAYLTEEMYQPSPDDIRPKDGAIKQATGFYFIPDHENKQLKSPYKLKKINTALQK